MAIALTENAARQIQKSLSKRGKGIGLRLGVKKVGCSGFAYTFDYADEVGANDSLFESHDAKVVVDGRPCSIWTVPRWTSRAKASRNRSSSTTPTPKPVRLRRELQRLNALEPNAFGTRA